MQILVCGVGTLGGNLVEHLVRVQGDSLQIRVIDFDRVEQRNLRNQPYFSHQVGKPKVTSLAENVYRISGQRLETHHKTLTAGNAERWLEGCDLVCDCFDNHAARLALQKACRKQGVPCLHLGLASDYGEVIWDPHYQVPPDSQRDPCAEPLSRSLALLTVALFDDCWRAYRQQGQLRNLCFTAGDLAVSSPTL
jgi:molybdopterin/thiamine biosynthesis adenylyltransferase